jgi:hypothetical protein
MVVEAMEPSSHQNTLCFFEGSQSKSLLSAHGYLRRSQTNQVDIPSAKLSFTSNLAILFCVQVSWQIFRYGNNLKSKVKNIIN